MKYTDLKLNSAELIHWFNVIRQLPDHERYRALEAFWAGQMDSKCWLINNLNDHVTEPSNIYVFGGWLGVLSSMLFQGAEFDLENIISIDIDPWCEPLANALCQPHHQLGRFKAVTADMMDYRYEAEISPDIIINTSSEHVDQGTYDAWYEAVPSGALVVVQGNDFFNCLEHVRCSRTLGEFTSMNHVQNPIYIGALPHDLYTRFMAIWRKL